MNKTDRRYILEGANIALRALQESDIEGNWFDWFNDPDVTKYLATGAFPNTREKQRLFYQENVVNSDNQAILAIVDKKTGKHIGIASIRNINWVHRTGDIAIIIGEKEFWMGNNALEAYYLTIKYAFLNLNLNRLFTATMAPNEVSLKYCERVGFKNIGVGREVYFKNGTYIDCVYADILKREWLEREGFNVDTKERSNERICV